MNKPGDRHYHVELVSRSAERTPGNHYKWECKCLLCGGSFLALPCVVKAGRVKSCKQCSARHHTRKNWVDYTDTIQNETVKIVEEAVGRDEAGCLLWQAVCLYRGCGNTFTVSSRQISKGLASCGCKSPSMTRKRHLDKYK